MGLWSAYSQFGYPKPDQEEIVPGKVALSKITGQTTKQELFEMATTGLDKDLKRSATGFLVGHLRGAGEAQQKLSEIASKRGRFNETLCYYAARGQRRTAEHATSVNYEEREHVRVAAGALSVWSQMLYYDALTQGREPLKETIDVPPEMIKSKYPDVSAMAITAAAYAQIPGLWDTDIAEAPAHLAGVRGAKLWYAAMMDIPLEMAWIVDVLEAPERNHITEMGPELAGPHAVLPDAAYACKAIAKAEFTDAKKALAKWSSHDDLRVQIEAARALVKMGGEDCVIPFAMALKRNCPWPLLIPVTEGLAANPDKRVMPLLIQRLQKEDGRMRQNLLHCLASIAGDMKGTNSTEWIAWYRESYQDFEVDAERSAAWRTANSPTSITIPRNTSFFNLPVTSSRFVYLLDSTELMKKGRIYAAREKTFESLRDLRKGAKYGLIELQDDIKYINERQLVADNRAGAFHILDMERSGVNRRSFDALYKALMYPEVDTIYYLSAGPPLNGSIPYWREMRYALESLTRYRPVHIHIIDMAPVPATRGNYESVTKQFGGTYTIFEAEKAGDDPRFLKEGD